MAAAGAASVSIRTSVLYIFLIVLTPTTDRPVAKAHLILEIEPELKAEVFRAARETDQSASRFTRKALRAEVARVRAQREKMATSRDDLR